jgi:hypothetical protein
MEIVLKCCDYCCTKKRFWLRNAQEAGFYCRCGVNRIMRNYYDASYIDGFIGLMPARWTVEELLELAIKEHMHIDPEDYYESFPNPNIKGLDIGLSGGSPSLWSISTQAHPLFNMPRIDLAFWQDP